MISLAVQSVQPQRAKNSVYNEVLLAATKTIISTASSKMVLATFLLLTASVASAAANIV